MLSITHLNTGQRDDHSMLCTQFQDAGIAIMTLCVVVARCHFSCVTAGVVPPVNTGYLEGDLHCSACWLPLRPAAGLPGHFGMSYEHVCVNMHALIEIPSSRQLQYCEDGGFHHGNTPGPAGSYTCRVKLLIVLQWTMQHLQSANLTGPYIHCRQIRICQTLLWVTGITIHYWCMDT